MKIRDPAKDIHQPVLLIIGHRIDGKVPSQKILMQIPGERHLLRMTAVFILSIDPVGCHFKPFIPHKHRDRSMLDSRIEGLMEQRLRLFRHG